MPITENDLQKKRDRLDKLREQIADAETTASAHVTDQAYQVEMAQLEAEEARLETQLARAKASAKVTVAKDGATGPLQAAKEQLAAAQAAKEAPVGPVDPNEGVETPDDKKE
jgi:predicted  nucleic acid-binding Zn-ribbon protein